MCDSLGLQTSCPKERSLREAAFWSLSRAAIALEQSPSSKRRRVTDSEARVGNGLSSVNAQQGHERQEADVLADHASRAVAHANSNRPRMEAVAECPDPLVRAIEDAQGPGSEPLLRSGKIGACSLAGVAIIETAPATARIVGPRYGARTATCVNVAKMFGALPAPRYPAWPPAPDVQVRGSGDLGEEDRGLRAIADFLKSDGSGDANFRVVTVGHGGRAAGGAAFAGQQ